MTSGSTQQCPFVAGPRVEDPKRFVGRVRELKQLAVWMSEAQPISVSIVGPARIGKSSLLYQFSQVWDTLVQNPQSYAVVYLPLAELPCQTEAQFFRAIAEALLAKPQVSRNRALSEPLKSFMDRGSFSAAMAQWRGRGILPVLCLDNVEILIQNRETFDNGFFDALESLIQRHSIMVVMTTQSGLKSLQKQSKLQSPFFESKPVLTLGELGEADAQALISQGSPPILSITEQASALQWAKRHPYHLQLAGLCIWEARQDNLNVEDARRLFRQQTQGSHRGSLDSRRWWSPFRTLVWGLPLWFGQYSTILGVKPGSFGNWVAGILLIIAIEAVLLLYFNWDQVQDILRTFQEN